MKKIGIFGHTGRLGTSLVKILNSHPYVEIVYTHSKSEPSKITLSESKAELVFSALEKGVSKEYEHEWREIRVIDLSIDHRDDPKCVYGVPELNREQIRNAQYVANPGCYATAILEALLPVKDIVTDIKIKAYSGVSGRPNQPVLEAGGIERYAKGRGHPQIAEIEKYLGKKIKSFEPHIVYPLETGIVAKIEAQLQDSSDAHSLFKNSLKDKLFVKLVESQTGDEINIYYLKKKLAKLINSNYCHISFAIKDNKLTIISSLDNLIKGGAGQAVQNMNLMLGFEETAGLMR